MAEKNLRDNSPLLKILKNNNAGEIKFWIKFSKKMILFSNKVNAFNKRMKNLKEELKEFYGDDPNKPRPIGFRVPNV